MAELVTLPGIKGQFAAGLSWRHSDTKPTAKSLRELAQEGGRWGIVRETTTGHYQIGSCDGVDGVKSPRGVRPLAAIVADCHQEPWMGLYPLEGDRYWYIAVRDGGEVIPDGDLIGPLDVLMAVRNEHSRLGSWNEVNGTFDDLAEMVRATPRHLGLRDLQARPWVPVAVATGIACVVGAGLGGYAYVQNQREEQVRQANLARARAIAAARKATADAEARVLPWTREPMPGSSIDACQSAWTAQPLAIKGWMLAGWKCDIAALSVTVTAEWSRQGGVAIDAPGRLGADANTSSISTQLERHFPAPSSLAWSAEEAKRAIHTVAQGNGLELKMSAPSIAPQLPGVSPKGDQPVNVWTANPVEVSMLAPPWMNGLAAQFSAVAGLRIRTIAWSSQSQKWTADATLYALNAPANAGIAGPSGTAARKASK